MRHKENEKTRKNEEDNFMLYFSDFRIFSSIYFTSCVTHAKITSVGIFPDSTVSNRQVAGRHARDISES